MLYGKRKILMVLLSMFVLLLITGCASNNEDGAGDNGDGDLGNFPDQPIQMIVSYSAGAATDTQARILTQYAEEEFGQSVSIINVEGSGGSDGWNQFSTVEPDGYTITAYNLPHVLSKPLVETTEYTKDTFIPLANWGYDPVVFGVLPDSPFESMEDIVEAAKEDPGSISVGNAGLYVGQHIATLMLEEEADIELQPIEYDGASDAQTGLLGGDIDVQAGNLSDMYRLGDELRILGVAAKDRHDYIPDVPTLEELDYDVVMSTDRGVSALDGTPPEIVERLSEGFLKIMESEDYQEDMEKAGADILILNAEEMKEDFNTRSEEIEKVLDSLGHLE